MTELTTYPEWAGAKLADPRKATMDQIENGLVDIVATEGPILVDRLFSLYAKAADLGRVYTHTHTRLENGLKQALKNKSLTKDVDEFGAFEEAALRLPDQAPVLVRGRGPRSLHEIPAPETAEVMLDIRLQHELISREDLFRAVLKSYGLIRLTKASEDRLEAILETWIM
jgi:hypothetical protein